MAIKIYNTQIAPTTEVGERKSTRAMQIDLNTAAAPGRAMGNMFASGERLYVKYEERKSKNSALKAYDVAVNGNENFEGLNQAKVKAGLMTDPDKAAAYYQAEYNKVKGYLENNVDGIFGKRFFNEKLAVAKISDMNTVKKNSYLNFIQETRTVELKSMEPDIFKAATSQEGSVEHKIATDNLINKFASPEFKELFGAKAKQVEFQTWEGVDILKFSNDLENDAIDTYDKILEKDKDSFTNYKNLSADKRMQLVNSAKNAAQAMSSREMKKYYASAKIGEASNYTKEKLLKPWKDSKEYTEMFEFLTISDIVRDNSLVIKDSEYGQELNLIQNIEVTGEQLAFKEKAKKHLEQIAYEKMALIQKDAAGYYIASNEDLKVLEKEINLAESTDNFERAQTLISERSSLLDEIYEEKNVPIALRKYISEAEANNIVAAFNNEIDVNKKIGYLFGLSDKYGDKMPDIYNQLQDANLPGGATLILSTNNRDLQLSIANGFDVKSLEKNIQNSTMLKGSDLSNIKKGIAEQLNNNGYATVVNNQPAGELDQVNHINMVTDALYQGVLYKMFNENLTTDKAVSKIIEAHSSDYKYHETFWIPKDVNGTAVNQDLIEQKADYILEEIKLTDYLNKIDLSHYGSIDQEILNEDRKFVVGQLDSKFENLSKQQIQELMVSDIKNNGNWYLNEKGDGLLLYVPRENGMMIPISDANGARIEIKFTDTYNLMPITGVEIPDNKLLESRDEDKSKGLGASFFK